MAGSCVVPSGVTVGYVLVNYDADLTPLVANGIVRERARLVAQNEDEPLRAPSGKRTALRGSNGHGVVVRHPKATCGSGVPSSLPGADAVAT